MMVPYNSKFLLSVIPAKAGIQALLKFIASSCRSGNTSIVCTIIFILLFITHPVVGASVPDLEDRTREIASELRCVVCQNLSVADSPSEMAQQMRAIVREQLEA